MMAHSGAALYALHPFALQTCSLEHMYASDMINCCQAGFMLCATCLMTVSTVKQISKVHRCWQAWSAVLHFCASVWSTESKLQIQLMFDLSFILSTQMVRPLLTASQAVKALLVSAHCKASRCNTQLASHDPSPTKVIVCVPQHIISCPLTSLSALL